MEEGLKAKAELVLGGGVRLPEGFRIPVRVSRSTAGPGAGSGSLVFAFGGHRVKKPVSYGEGEFDLHEDGGALSLWKDGRLIADGVRIVPVGFHAPEQAFFTIDERCMFRCAFCASPHLDASASKGLTPEKVVGMIRGSEVRDSIKAIAFTSGVVVSVEHTVGLFADFVRAAREAFPDLPIGVEPYVDDPAQIRMLKDAGADEIKINTEAATRGIFSKVCPDLDYDSIPVMLEEAVRVFGRGRVASNLIYGLGETDDDIRRKVEELASMGVLVNLRPLKCSSVNLGNLAAAGVVPERISPERALALSDMQREAFARHGLDPSDSRTMCFSCGCCDLIPLRPSP